MASNSEGIEQAAGDQSRLGEEFDLAVGSETGELQRASALGDIKTDSEANKLLMSFNYLHAELDRLRISRFPEFPISRKLFGIPRNLRVAEPVVHSARVYSAEYRACSAEYRAHGLWH